MFIDSKGLYMSDIDDFMRNRKPTGKSKLDVYTDDILTLKKYGYSNADVLLYLSEKKNITVGSATLTRFLAKHRENSLGKSGVRTIPLDERPKKDEPLHNSPNVSPIQRERPAFDWQKKIDPSELK